MSHAISNLHMHQSNADTLRISNPQLLHKLCKAVFKNDPKGERLTQETFEPKMIKTDLPEKKIVDALFHPPY